MSVDAVTLTAVRNREDVWGGTRTNLFDVTFSTGYPSGGYTFSPHRVGLSTLQAVQNCGGNTAGFAVFAYYNTQTGKLQVMAQPTGLEVPDNTDIHLDTLRLRFEGQ
jgi:hypothetical protein